MTTTHMDFGQPLPRTTVLTSGAAALRTTMFWCHLVLGVLGGAVILLMSATGVLLTYERQLLSLADGRVSIDQGGLAQRLPLGVLLDRARVAGDGASPTALTVRADASAPVTVGFGLQTVRLNPYTGEVLADRVPGLRAFFRTVTDWHRWLALDGASRVTGRAITGASNLAFLCLVVSGCYLWWPRRLSWSHVRAVVLLSGGLKARARDFNWHNVIGFWAALPLVVIVLGGVVISYPWASDLVYRALGDEPPPRQRLTASPAATSRAAMPAAASSPAEGPRTAPVPLGAADTAGLDRALAVAAAHDVSWRTLTVRLGGPTRSAASVVVDTGTGGQPQYRTTLDIDRASGAVVRVEAFADQSSGRRARTWLRFAHTGEVFGAFGQTIAGAASLGAVFLVATGLSLALRRLWAFRRRRASAGSPRTVRVALVVFLLAISPVRSAVSAQSHPSVTGRIVDATGAAVPGASVVLRLQSGTEVADVASGDDGRFAFESIAPGSYTVTTTLPGFSMTRVELRMAGRPIALELVLRPGDLAEELTVLGSRLAGSEEMLRRVPGSFNLLTRDTLARSHVFTTSEALRKLPGVTVRDEEGLGLRPNIGMRGLNPTRSSKVLLLEDGVPIAFAPYGDNASYYHPPIERFDRIEVLKGSSQIVHGPVTLGGVVNYITPEAPPRPSAAFDVTGGNRAYANLTGSFGGSWSRLGVFTQAIWKQGRGARDNVHSELADVMGKVTRGFGTTQQLSVKGNYFGEGSQVTYSGLRDAEYAAAPRQNPFANDAFDGGRSGFSAVHRALAFSRLALTSTVYASRFARDWWRQSSTSSQRPNDASDPACGGMANLSTTCGNEGRLRRYRHAGADVRGRLGFRLGFMHELDAGVRWHGEQQDRRQENGATPTARSGPLVEDNRRTTDALSAFVQHRVLAGAFTLTPGVRVERIGYGRTNRLLGVSGEAELTEFVPGIGASYSPTPATTLFAGMHRGFAPPRAEDIINNTTGGVVDLDPERSWNYELGGRTRLASHLQVDATVFRLDYENQIVPASLAGGVGALLTNGGATRQQGAEAGAEGEWRRLRGSGHGVFGRLAVTMVPVARFAGVRTSSVSAFSTVSVSGNRLPYAPKSTVSASVGYLHEAGLSVQLEAQQVGDQFSDDLNTVEGTPDGQRGLIPAFTYWNAAASWRLPLGGSVFVTVKNITDRTFIVDRSRGILPGHPRLVQGGVSWRF